VILYLYRSTDHGDHSIERPQARRSGGFAADIETDLGVADADIDYVIVTTAGHASKHFTAEWVSSSDKIKAYEGGAEVTATTNLSSVDFHITVKVKNTTA
jgi:phage tail tube protein FII